MAYVILKAGGKQYKVAEGDVIDIAKLDAEAGQETTFSDILFHADGDKHSATALRLLSGASVVGEVVEQRKADKVIAFKYRRRKGYHRTVGHRQKLTRVKIKSISFKA